MVGRALVISKFFEVVYANVMVNRYYADKPHLQPKPSLRLIVGPVQVHHPYAKYEGGYHCGVGDAAQQLPFHYFKSLEADLVICHGMINK